MEVKNFERAPSAPTVYERDGQWYWADEAWTEHGPCATEDDAKFTQGIYVAWYLEGEPRPTDEKVIARCRTLGIPIDDWK